MANIALITNNVLSDSGTALTSVVTGSGTTNYLSKFTGSTALGNSLIYDDGTFVGIGTTTPTSKFNLYGGTITVSSSTTNRTTRVTDSGFYLSRTSDGGYASSITADGTMYYDTRNSHIFRNDGTASMTIVDNTRNVLIGTSTDAGYKLDVNGTARISSSLLVGSSYGTFYVSNTTDWAYNITGGEAAVILAANVQGSTRTIYGCTVPAFSANLILGTSYGYNIGQTYNIISYAGLGINVNRSTQAAYFDVYGNLGLGTSSPGAKLQVNGSVTASGAIAIGTYITNTLVAAANSDVLVGLDIAPTFTNGAFTGVSNIGIRVSNSILIGSTLLSTNTTAFPLQVNLTNAASNVGAIWRNGSSTGYTSFRFYNDQSLGTRALEMGYSGSAYSGAIISGGITGESAYITSTGAYPLQFGTSNTTRAIITSGGNLLIGTTTDSGYKLDVNGTSVLRGQITYTQPYTGATTSRIGLFLNDGNLSYSNSENWVLWGTNTGAQNAGIKAVWLGNNGYEMGLTFHTATGGNGAYSWPAGSEVMRLLNNKNVLIGSSGGSGDSGYKLHVVNNGYYTAANGSLNAGNTLYVLNSGNVLIGTTTDGGYKLSVNGSGNFNLGNSGYIRLQSGSGQRHGYIQSAFSNFLFSNNIYYDGSNWRYDQNGYGAQIQTETLSVGVIAFNTFASGTGGGIATIIESMRIVNNGNILMGTTSDSGHKLQVNGTSKFTNSIALTGSNRYIASGSSSQSLALYGGSAYTDGAYFNVTGNTYGASPGGGSAEFVIRTNSDSKFALFGYNGSSWSRYMTLFGPTGNLNIGYGTSDSGYKLQVQGNTNLDGELTVGSTTYLNAPLIQQQPYNTNAFGSITSFITQDNLTYSYYNNTYHGETITGELASTVIAGQVVAMRASTLQWELADASTAASIGKNMLGIACYGGDGGDTITILLRGFFASDTYYNNSGNYGVPMYLNANTSGSLTDVAPSTTGNIVRIVGHIDSYNNSNSCAVLRFNPDNSWLVI